MKASNDFGDDDEWETDPDFVVSNFSSTFFSNAID